MTAEPLQQDVRQPGLPDVGGNCRPEPNGRPVYELPGAAVRFTVQAAAVGKPIMTRTDRFRAGRTARPCVQAYRDWCDQIRQAADRCAWPAQLQGRALAVVWLPFPPSYTARQRQTLRGTPHWGKPDADNIMKGILDALFEHDSFVYDERCVKLWDDGQGPRVEISIA